MGETAVYSSEKGFFYETINITIGSDCSGFNFWSLSFGMLVFRGISFYKTDLQRVSLFFAAAIICYFATIFANTTRILLAIRINAINIDWHHKYKWLHEIQGNIVYLSALIIFYLAINYFLKNNKNNKINEKLIQPALAAAD